MYSIEDIVRILLNPNLDLVCTKVPSSISSNVAFVVDTSKLEDMEDITADDMGVWKNNRVDTGYVECRWWRRKYKLRNVVLLLLGLVQLIP